jgi:hypothetical protein
MKTKKAIQMAAALVLATIHIQFSIASAQGVLTPPGPPEPTMLTLNQIEPRTPISLAPYTISQPGSYFLTTNLNLTTGLSAITIAASDVTLDLSGFTISSTTYPLTLGSGILISSNLSNITIKNGFIHGGTIDLGNGNFSGGGFGSGISLSGNAPNNVEVAHISVSGVAYYGIELGDLGTTIVESCNVNAVGEYGISANIVKGCLAFDCGYSGIQGVTVSDSQGSSVYPVDGGPGIEAATAQNCSGTSIDSDGLDANDCALNCYGYAIGNGNGINAQIAQNCWASANGTGDGLMVSSAENCFGYNSNNGRGISAEVAQNCTGQSYGNADGIDAYTALNCYGYSDGGGTGLNAAYSAIGCFGYSYSGTGLNAFIANICHGQSQLSTTLSTSHNINSY